MKRAIIVHGWDGFPEEAWFPWLKHELEVRGFQVEVPQMPEASAPKIDLWVPKLAEVVGAPDEELVLIGHSMGVQTIIRYLESIDRPIAGFASVSGFFTLIPGSIGSADDERVAEPWLMIPIDTDKVKVNAKRIVAIFSDNDKYVPLENVELFKNRLGAETIILHSRGHIGGGDNVKELPEVLEWTLGNGLR